MQTLKYEAVERQTETFSGCKFCMIYKSGLCFRSAAPIAGATTSEALNESVPEISIHTVHAGQMILHPREHTESVIFLCSGQAISSIGLADGRRQIFEILLPGDVVYWTVLFETTSGRLLEATEDSTYRKLKRDEFRALLSKQPTLFEQFLQFCTIKKEQCDQLALTLGRRTAPQRIAHLILDFVQRLTGRGEATAPEIRFPLRLRQIADATGLTSVHTSKVLRQFRNIGVVEFERPSLKILNIVKLRQIAGP